MTTDAKAGERQEPPTQEEWEHEFERWWASIGAHIGNHSKTRHEAMKQAHFGAFFDAWHRGRQARTAELAEARERIAVLERPYNAIREALKVHWLADVKCLHIIRSDVASCACGWTTPTLPTVGAAVSAWIDHVFEMSELARRVLASGSEKKGEGA